MRKVRAVDYNSKNFAWKVEEVVEPQAALGPSTVSLETNNPPFLPRRLIL